MNNRLIEVAFPLKQASLDSVHEKNVRHGHISTLHIWPARRPLAACRAALIATLLPDPGNAEERKKLLEKLGGTVVEVMKKKKLPSGRVEEKKVEETVGGILHWGRESGPDLEWFRQRIREAYGGRAPRVLDPFAGGGAIPLEAMRLGCEVTAIDINPVAWFILKCTLEYPQKLAGQHRPLPKFALESPEFMEGFFKGTGKLTKKQLERNLQAVQTKLFPPPDVDLAWHGRAWGWWVLQCAKADLERFYPVVDSKPTVAYLWARTVTCKNCRAIVPLLKTRWLCKKDNKRMLLTMEPKADGTGVIFGVQTDVPVVGSNAAQRREHDKRIGVGTMSRSGATCPCCKAIMTMEDIRFEGQAGRLGTMMTAVVVDGKDGKEYRLPTEDEIKLAAEAEDELSRVFAEVPFGLPQEPTPKGGSGASRAFSVDGYGFDQWQKLFTPRQLLALGTFVKHTRNACRAMRVEGYSPEWTEAIAAYLAITLDRAANYMSTICIWEPVASEIKQTFLRFALPITWDFAEANPLTSNDRFYAGAISNVGLVLDGLLPSVAVAQSPKVINQSAVSQNQETFDIVLTDPPYYDAIPYSDLMDFFYVWLRRTLHRLSEEFDTTLNDSLAPKWNKEKNDGELIDDANRFEGDKAKSKVAYEEGMFRAFQACYKSLNSEGRLVIVFAHKQPDAWETLVSAIIRAGFVVNGSWPIMTEMRGGVRNFGRASLSSSVWLVCKKRQETSRPGWDNRILEEMYEKITTRLRDFWDAGIRGPDFVWAATGPALEAYSKHPVVKKANESGQLMAVSEFLRHVRRIVVDFVVGRVLSGNGDTEAVSGLDDVTTYYLLHRHDFQMEEAPIGACILYAVSCGLSDSTLANQHDILVRTGGQAEAEDDEQEVVSEAADEEPEEGTGSKVKLKAWRQRTRKSLGYEAPGGRPVPLIDQIHRLMHLWKAGDVIKVDEYLEAKALRRNVLFHQLLQALIELAPAGSEERSLLESISNHVVARGVVAEQMQRRLPGI
jgi:adenine-specific DNA methylase